MRLFVPAYNVCIHGCTYVHTCTCAYYYIAVVTHSICSLPIGVCIARSLKIPREVNPDTFDKIMAQLLEYSRAKIVVLFVNEDNCRRLIASSIKLNRTNAFIWLASDSWGAKIVPVDGQEWAAEGAITILPQRKVLQGTVISRTNMDLLFILWCTT